VSEQRPTDEELQGWAYAAEYDWSADYDETKPMPEEATRFPPDYDESHDRILAGMCREILKLRKLVGNG
jgi:hypothetical protein